MACTKAATVAPIVITEQIVTFNPFTENVKEIFEAKEKAVPEFLTYSTENCPPGLEFLLPSGHITLKKVVECCRMPFCSYDKFDIFDDRGNKIIRTTAGDCCESGFVTTLKKEGELLLRAKWKPPCCDSFCRILCGITRDKGLRVEAPKGNLLGFVSNHLDVQCCSCPNCDCCNGCDCCKECDCCKKCDCCKGCLVSGVITKPVYFVMDSKREVMLTINIELEFLCWACVKCCPSCCLPCSTCKCKCECGGCCDQIVETIYTIRANNEELIGAGTRIGYIKKTEIVCCSCCPKPPEYDIVFPEDLDVRMKVLLMSAIPYMYSEHY